MHPCNDRTRRSRASSSSLVTISAFPRSARTAEACWGAAQLTLIESRKCDRHRLLWTAKLHRGSRFLHPCPGAASYRAAGVRRARRSTEATSDAKANHERKQGVRYPGSYRASAIGRKQTCAHGPLLVRPTNRCVDRLVPDCGHSASGRMSSHYSSSTHGRGLG
jgi:hypothetical protein